MNVKNAMLLAVLVAAVASFAACTLLLPTEELITPCVSDEECDEGFECLDNACLPLDEDAQADQVSG